MPLPIFIWSRHRPSSSQLAQSQEIMSLGFLAMVLLACAPAPSYMDEFNTKSDQRLVEKLQLIKEEDCVTVPIRCEQANSQPP